eukprot:11005176-Prorocentrum_lima.AAC.1
MRHEEVAQVLLLLVRHLVAAGRPHQTNRIESLFPVNLLGGRVPSSSAPRAKPPCAPSPPPHAACALPLA